jgi:hypothetical protein
MNVAGGIHLRRGFGVPRGSGTRDQETTFYRFARSITAFVQSSRSARFVRLAAQALAQRVVPLARNSFETQGAGDRGSAS